MIIKITFSKLNLRTFISYVSVFLAFIILPFNGFAFDKNDFFRSSKETSFFDKIMLSVKAETAEILIGEEGKSISDYFKSYSEEENNASLVATITVTNTNDTGAGSLRQAITDANATAAADIIAFNISGAGPHTISPASPFPTMTKPVFIDGSTQSGYTSTPLIEINGTSIPSYGSGLYFANNSNSGIKALCINRAQSRGVYMVNSTNMTVEDCIIGMDPTGLIPLGNAGMGLSFSGDGILISGCVITNNGGGQFQNVSGANIEITDNIIGLDITGTTAHSPVGTSIHGIEVRAADNVLIQDNVVSASSGHGLFLSGAGTNLEVLNNKIGTDISGNIDFGNGVDGINLSVYSPVDIFDNVIAGSGRYGISAGNNNFSFLRNRVGIGTNGADIGNGLTGVYLQDQSTHIFTNSQVGDGTIANANIIAYNGKTSASSDGISIRKLGTTLTIPINANIIHDNADLGIDLQINGVTSNDAGDGDIGANDFLNFPVVNSSELTTDLAVDFDLDVPAGDYRVEVFGIPAGSEDPSMHGEANTYLGFFIINHTGSGSENFVNSIAGPVSIYVGDKISLTTTSCIDATCTGFEYTSELSEVAEIAAIPEICNNGIDDDGDGLIDDADPDAIGCNAYSPNICTVRDSNLVQSSSALSLFRIGSNMIGKVTFGLNKTTSKKGFGLIIEDLSGNILEEKRFEAHSTHELNSVQALYDSTSDLIFVNAWFAAAGIPDQKVIYAFDTSLNFDASKSFMSNLTSDYSNSYSIKNFTYENEHRIITYGDEYSGSKYDISLQYVNPITGTSGTNVYSSTATNGGEAMNAMQVESGSQLVLARSYVGGTTPDINGTLIKLNSAGNVVASKYYTGTGGYFMGGVMNGSLDNYVTLFSSASFTLYEDSYFLMITVDQDLNLVSSKKIELAGNLFTVFNPNIQRLPDGTGYIISAKTKDSSTNLISNCVMRLDNSYNIVWAKKIESAMPGATFFVDRTQTILTNKVAIVGGLLGSEVTVILDFNGNIEANDNCLSTVNINPTITDIPLVAVDLSYTVSNNNLVAAPAPTEFNSTREEFCCVEICNNGIDDNGDGQIDEGCCSLPASPLILKRFGAPTICDILTANPADPIGALDCDGGGFDNLTECQNGSDPEDPSDDVTPCTTPVAAGIGIYSLTIQNGENETPVLPIVSYLEKDPNGTTDQSTWVFSGTANFAYTSGVAGQGQTNFIDGAFHYNILNGNMSHGSPFEIQIAHFFSGGNGNLTDKEGSQLTRIKSASGGQATACGQCPTDLVLNVAAKGSALTNIVVTGTSFYYTIDGAAPISITTFVPPSVNEVPQNVTLTCPGVGICQEIEFVQETTYEYTDGTAVTPSPVVSYQKVEVCWGQ